MPEYSQTENEDAKYEIWLETGGPIKAQVKHHKLADAACDALQAEGWDILLNTFIKGLEFPIKELVIRRDSDVRIVVWHPGNQEWFTSNGPGLGSSPLRLVLKNAEQEQSNRRTRYLKLN